MCTAITFKTKDFYFGRTLDYEFSFGEEVTITPRNYEIKFSNKTILKTKTRADTNNPREYIFVLGFFLILLRTKIVIKRKTPIIENIHKSVANNSITILLFYQILPIYG